jgi:hypothetical protein
VASDRARARGQVGDKAAAAAAAVAAASCRVTQVTWPVLWCVCVVCVV